MVVSLGVPLSAAHAVVALACDLFVSMRRISRCPARDIHANAVQYETQLRLNCRVGQRRNAGGDADYSERRAPD